MLKALGYSFVDWQGREVPEGVEGLDRIAAVSDVNVAKELKECRFQIACDVKNPLCGEKGAVYVYGPQKGVKQEECSVMDRKMSCFARKTAEYFGVDNSLKEGAGAAGGLGFAFLSYLPDVQLKPGIEIVFDAIHFEEEVKDADIVITGEGRLDFQTAMGKAPVGAARLAKKYGAKVIAFVGSVTEDAGRCNEEGIDAFFPIVRGVTTLDEAMLPVNARRNMELAVEQVFRLIACGNFERKSS